jgi:signal transduction histidine kinase
MRAEVASSTAEFRLLRPDGRAVWASVSCSATGDGGPLDARRELVVQLVDVTERRQAERELTRSNDELSSFAFLAAHELKSPLQSLSGFTALLDRIHGPSLDPQAREFVAWIMDGAARMDTLIDALLAYCVVDRAETVLAPVGLQHVLSDALGQVDREVSAGRAVVTAGPLPVVTGDPVQLGQLLQNLLSNALKFVPDGRAPEVEVSAERTADGWTITVADNGAGMPPEVAAKIFEPLFTTKGERGTGLGLAMAYGIVERHGGQIAVDSAPGRGTTVELHLGVER